MLTIGGYVPSMQSIGRSQLIDLNHANVSFPMFLILHTSLVSAIDFADSVCHNDWFIFFSPFSLLFRILKYL